MRAAATTTRAAAVSTRLQTSTLPKVGDKYTLGNVELGILINRELSTYLGECKDPARINKIMSDLDKNKDGKVDFEEFVAIVAKCTVLCHNFFVGRQQLLS